MKRTATRQSSSSEGDFRVERLERRALNRKEVQLKAPQGKAEKRTARKSNAAIIF